jgi:hypothetical protein
MMEQFPRPTPNPDEQLNEICKQILFLLEDCPQVELSELASRLHVLFSTACMAVGRLIRSRVLTLGGTSDALSIRFRGLLQ